MPKRKTILATEETYHIFNRSIHHTPLFTTKREFDLFLTTIKYYLQLNPAVKFSHYRQQPNKYKLDFNNSLVKIIAYCLMPNHYHLILTQLVKNGIKTFIHKSATSYAHFFNIKHKKKGPVFEGKFKAVRIESQEQLVHLSRYIHLNPVTSYLVEDPIEYNYSSYKIYLGKEKSDFVDPSDIMVDFPTPKHYQEFVLNQKEYQRDLDKIKHLTYE